MGRTRHAGRGDLRRYRYVGEGCPQPALQRAQVHVGGQHHRAGAENPGRTALIPLVGLQVTRVNTNGLPNSKGRFLALAGVPQHSIPFNKLKRNIFQSLHDQPLPLSLTSSRASILTTPLHGSSFDWFTIFISDEHFSRSRGDYCIAPSTSTC